jgi:hypothetical protein
MSVIVYGAARPVIPAPPGTLILTEADIDWHAHGCSRGQAVIRIGMSTRTPVDTAPASLLTA